MSNQDKFWGMLTSRIEKLKNLDDDVTITIEGDGDYFTGLEVCGEHFSHNGERVQVEIGDGLELTLYKKAGYTHLNSEPDYEDDEMLDVVHDEIEARMRFTGKLYLWDIF